MSTSNLRLCLISSILSLASAMAHAAPVALADGGFESIGTPAATGSDGQVTFQYRPSGTAWSYAGYAGVANSYSRLSAYEGNQFALLQMNTGSISQFFTLDQGGQVDLSFAIALRTGFAQYVAGQSVSVAVDGQELQRVVAGSTAWKLGTYDLGWLNAGKHNLTFSGVGVVGANGAQLDTTAFIDAVSLNQNLPEPASLALVAVAGVGLGQARRRPRSS